MLLSDKDEEYPNVIPQMLQNILLLIQEDDNKMLIEKVFESKVQEAIQGLDANKSPGPDGFLIYFSGNGGIQ